MKVLIKATKTILTSKCMYKIMKENIHYSSKEFKSFKNWYREVWNPKNLHDPPYQHVTQIGDPVLRQKSTEVPADSITSKQIKYLVDNMIYVLREHKCVGLAAPQIGISLRVIIMEFEEKLKKKFTPETFAIRQMETLPLTVFINPEMKVLNYNKKIFIESCASIKGYAADVPRYEEVELSGYNLNGEKTILKLNGWNARIAQHEMNHLDGIVYTDIMDSKTFTCTCWEAVNVHDGKINIPIGPKF